MLALGFILGIFFLPLTLLVICLVKAGRGTYVQWKNRDKVYCKSVKFKMPYLMVRVFLDELKHEICQILY